MSGAGIHTDVFFIGMFLVDRRGNQASVGSKHETAQLGVDGGVAHASGHHNLLEGPAHPSPMTAMLLAFCSGS